MKKSDKFFIPASLVFVLSLAYPAHSQKINQIIPDKKSGIVIRQENIFITPEKLKEGVTANFKAKVENCGEEKISNVVVEFYVDDKKIGEKTISSISKGGTSNASISYKIPSGMAGEHVLELKVKGIRESKKFFVFSNLPDLSVLPDYITVTPEKFKGGDKVRFYVKVRNEGVTAAKNVKVDFLINKEVIFTRIFPSISPNSFSYISYYYTVPVTMQSKMFFLVKVDPENSVAELEEKNNAAEKLFMCDQAEMDLVIDSFSVNQNNPKAGQYVTISVKVRNNGNTDVYNVPLNIYMGENNVNPVFTGEFGIVRKNAISSKSFSWRIPNNIPGKNYPLKAVIDPGNLIHETNELNNIKMFYLNLTAPDLSLSLGQGAAPTFCYPNTNPGLNVRICNDNVMVVDDAKVILFYSPPGNSEQIIKLDEKRTGRLNKNFCKQISLFGSTIPGTIPVGSIVKLGAILDPDGEIPEPVEENNRLIYNIQVKEKPKPLACPCLVVSVVDEDNQPINGALVTVAYGNQSESKTTGPDRYARNGEAIFENRTTNVDYKITVSKSGYRTQVLTVHYDSSNPDTYYPMFVMDKKALLTGKVTNNQGTAISGVRIRVEGTGLETTTDAEGKYGFLLNGGTYTLHFSKIGYNRSVEANRNVAPLSTVVMDKVLTPGNVGYWEGRVTDDEGNGLSNVDILKNDSLIGTSSANGSFAFQIPAGMNIKFTFKKQGYVTTEFRENIDPGDEYYHELVMYKPSTENHVERGATFVSWHQHEGTPSNAFFIPEYNVDVWWGIGNVKMGLDFTKSGDRINLNKLTINVKGMEWECHRVEGEGEIETSAIDVPIKISAGGCTDKLTQVDVYKVAIESGGQEVWQSSGFWSSASQPQNSNTRTFPLNNLPVTWDNSLKVKLWIRVQKKSAYGTDGEGSGALAGYNMDRKLITWYPQKPPTTKISTSWSQISGYFIGILDNPLNAISEFTDLFTVEQFEQYAIQDLTPQNFPGI